MSLPAVLQHHHASSLSVAGVLNLDRAAIRDDLLGGVGTAGVAPPGVGPPLLHLGDLLVELCLLGVDTHVGKSREVGGDGGDKLLQ